MIAMRSIWATMLAIACGGTALAQIFPWQGAFTPEPWSMLDIDFMLERIGLSTHDPRLLDAIENHAEGLRELRDRRCRPLELALHRLDAEHSAARGEIEESVDSELKSDSIEAIAQKRAIGLEPIVQEAARIQDAWYQLDSQLIERIRAHAPEGEGLEILDDALLWRQREMHLMILRQSRHHLHALEVAPPVRAPEELDDSEARQTFEAQLRLWHRESLETLKRMRAGFLRELRTGTRTDDHDRGARALVTQSICAIDDLAKILPDHLREPWRVDARNRLLHFSSLPMRTSIKRLEECLPFALDESLRRRLDEWSLARERIENEDMARITERFESPIERTSRLWQCDQKVMDDIHAAASGQRGYEACWEDISLCDLARAPWLPDSTRNHRTESRDLIDGPAPEFRRWSCADLPDKAWIQAVSETLQPHDEDRAVWNALCEDLIDESNALLRKPDRDWRDDTPLPDYRPEGSEPVIEPPGDPSDSRIRNALELPAMLHEHAALENRWFDSVAEIMTYIPKETIEAERSRRELERVIWVIGMLQRQLGCPTLRSNFPPWDGCRAPVNVDMVIDWLSPADQASLRTFREQVRREQVQILLNLIDGLQPIARSILDWQRSGMRLRDRAPFRSLDEPMDRYIEAVRALDEQAYRSCCELILARAINMQAVLPTDVLARLRETTRAFQFPIMGVIHMNTQHQIKEVMGSESLPRDSLESMATVASSLSTRTRVIFERYARMLEEFRAVSSSQAETDSDHSWTGLFWELVDTHNDYASICAITIRRMESLRAVSGADHQQAAPSARHAQPAETR